jgi:hypothetical protein
MNVRWVERKHPHGGWDTVLQKYCEIRKKWVDVPVMKEE